MNEIKGIFLMIYGNKAIHRLIATIAFICAITLLSSCENKNDAVRDLLILRTEIKNNSYSYTVEDWQNALDKFAEICDRLNEMDFTREEQLDLDEVKGEIVGYAASSASQQVVDAVESIKEEVDAFSNVFGKTFEKPKTKKYNHDR